MTYIIQNLLNRQKLRHNRHLYKKYGIKKSIYSPIGKKDVAHITAPKPWIDLEDAGRLVKEIPFYKALPTSWKEKVEKYIEDGYMILEGFLSADEVQEVNEQIEKLLGSKEIDFNYTGKKIVQSYTLSQGVNQYFFRNKKLTDLLSFLLGKDVIPFHTINFIEGSEQRAHSDSIHMATAPEGYLIAAWVALEPTDGHNGPLFVYPGSHKLSYVTCLDYDSGNSKYLIGNDSYKKYEDYIDEVIKENHLEKKYFYAQPGDLLIWHANLLHGGDPIRDENRTRKSMVAHYFGSDVLCFHEISQRPALLDL